MTKIEGPEEHGTWVNQAKDEPIPASHDDDAGQAASERNEQVGEEHVSAKPQDTGDDDTLARAADREPDLDGPGKAVEDMLPSGPPPQGDVPDAPAVQVAATKDPGADNEDSKPSQPHLMSNAVPGKPDGETDTRI